MLPSRCLPEYGLVLLTICSWSDCLAPGGRLNKKDGLTRYGNSHVAIPGGTYFLGATSRRQVHDDIMLRKYSLHSFPFVWGIPGGWWFPSQRFDKAEP